MNIKMDRHRQVYSPIQHDAPETEVNREDEVHYKVQYLFGQHFIPLDSALHPNEDEWYSQKRLGNGDIILRRRTLTS